MSITSSKMPPLQRQHTLPQELAPIHPTVLQRPFVLPCYVKATSYNANASANNAIVLANNAIVLADNAIVLADNAIVLADNAIVSTDMRLFRPAKINPPFMKAFV